MNSRRWLPETGCNHIEKFVKGLTTDIIKYVNYMSVAIHTQSSMAVIALVLVAALLILSIFFLRVLLDIGYTPISLDNTLSALDTVAALINLKEGFIGLI